MHAVQPDSGWQREKEMWQQAGCGEKAHLLGFGVKNQDGDYRDRQESDLITDY
jgi:hypothetical protein